MTTFILGRRITYFWITFIMLVDSSWQLAIWNLKLKDEMYDLQNMILELTSVWPGVCMISKSEPRLQGPPPFSFVSTSAVLGCIWWCNCRGEEIKLEM